MHSPRSDHIISEVNGRGDFKVVKSDFLGPFLVIRLLTTSNGMSQKQLLRGKIQTDPTKEDFVSRFKIRIRYLNK